MRKFLICLWSVIVLLGTVNAQSEKDPILRLKVQYDTVGIEEQFQIEYIFENAKAVNFATPSFEGLQLVSGPFQSSHFSMVNGVTSSSVSFAYVFRPTTLGNYTLSTQEVSIGNKTYSTPEATIEVVEEPNRTMSNVFNSPFGGSSLGFDNKLLEQLRKQQEEMMKRHEEFFNNPDRLLNSPQDLFNLPQQFAPEFNELFKNLENMLQFKMPPAQQPKKPEEKIYKL